MVVSPFKWPSINSLHCRLLSDLQKLLKSSQALVLNRILQSIKVILCEICKITIGRFSYFLFWTIWVFSLSFLPHKKSDLYPKVPSPNISNTLWFSQRNASKRKRDRVKYEQIIQFEIMNQKKDLLINLG